MTNCINTSTESNQVSEMIARCSLDCVLLQCVCSLATMLDDLFCLPCLLVLAYVFTSYFLSFGIPLPYPAIL